MLTEHNKCKIEYINSKGFGVGHTQQGEVLLPYVLPGEIVEFERHKYRGKSNCLLKNIESLSPRRSSPPCEYFTRCGGCLLQHLNQEDYIKFKNDKVRNALLAQGINCDDIADIILIEPGTRRRINIEGIKKNEQVLLGFHRLSSNTIVDIDKCIVLLPNISSLITPLKILLNSILNNKDKFHIFLTHASNGIDLSISINNVNYLDESKRNLLANFAKEHNIIRLIFCYRKTKDVIYQTQLPVVLFDDVPVSIDAQSFLQASFESDNILSNLVVNFVVFNQINHLKILENNDRKINFDNKVVDLFCGRGTYTIPVGKYCSVDGFEFDKNAVIDITKAISQYNRNIQIIMRDLFENPLLSTELDKYNTLIINPPRSGAEFQCKNIKSCNIEKICYISCNPETFANDAAILISNGYKLVTIVPVDQFYWSAHLELVGLFIRI